jgi:hypothetical protein
MLEGLMSAIVEADTELLLSGFHPRRTSLDPSPYGGAHMRLST